MREVKERDRTNYEKGERKIDTWTEKDRKREGKKEDENKYLRF